MRILVPTDLSANSRAGIRFALQLAGQMNECTLLFCHFIEVTKPTSWSEKKYASFAGQRTGELETQLRDFIGEIYEQSGLRQVPHEFIVRINTNIITETLSLARKYKADLICLGTRGAGKMKKLLGSNAASLLIKSAKPVIVVPPSWRLQTIDHVMYSSDLERPATELRTLLAFADRIGARVTLYHYTAQLVVSEDTSALERKVSRYRKGNAFDTQFRAFPPGKPLESLLVQDAKKERASLLAMFTRQKRSWFSRLFEPSHASALAAHPTLPVLVFRK